MRGDEMKQMKLVFKVVKVLCLRVLKSTLAEVNIPDSVYYSLARVLLPEILKDLEEEKTQSTEKESKTDLKLQTAV